MFSTGYTSRFYINLDMQLTVVFMIVQAAYYLTINLFII